MKSKKVMSFVLIVAAVLIGMTFIMSSSASAAVAAPGANIVRPTMDSTVIAPKVLAPKGFIGARPFIAPRPFVKQIFNPFFFPRFNPFFFGVNPFLFNEGVVGAGIVVVD